MASIVVSGDTSGAVTIEAPAIAGSPTLTLPTTSGTILTTAGGQTVPFAVGSAAAPSITFTGDTNTGIFSPTADTVGFTTGGSERMRIDSSGQVGVGVTPNTWSTGRVIEVGVSGTSLWGLSSGTSYVTAGYYFNSTDKFALTGNYAIFSQLVPSDGSFRWYSSTATGTAGNNATMSERMRIDSSGNVGIGTSTITSSAGWSPRLVLAGTDTALVVKGSSGQENSFGTSGGLYIDSLGHSTGTSNNIIFRNTSTNSSYSASERMRITSGGTLLVGTTTETTLSSVIWKTTLSGGGNNLAVVNTTTDGSTTSGFQASNYTPSGANVINIYNGSGSFAGSISVPTNASTGTTVAYNTSSDYRMKENIAPMIGALNKVLQLNPVTYTWKSNGYAGQGFIAHELQAVVPDAVTGEKDAVNADGSIKPQGVDTSFLVATLTAAIQEQQAMIEELKARIETLEAK